MYTKISNPKTGRKVNITSRLGKQIIRNYLNYLNGGDGNSVNSIIAQQLATITAMRSKQATCNAKVTSLTDELEKAKKEAASAAADTAQCLKNIKLTENNTEEWNEVLEGEIADQTKLAKIRGKSLKKRMNLTPEEAIQISQEDAFTSVFG